jgi:hypothetical protein
MMKKTVSSPLGSGSGITSPKDSPDTKEIKKKQSTDSKKKKKKTNGFHFNFFKT